MNHIKFVKEINAYKPIDAFIAHMSINIKDEDELFADLKSKLKFPDYFGFNWNAVWDCLRDFHWINEKGIVLVYTGLPNLELPLLKIYLDLLINASEDWKTEEDHYLEIVFSDESRKLVENILTEDSHS